MLTGLYAALFGVFYIWLSLRVVTLRRVHRQDIGDGGHTNLARAIRVHSNAQEYVPLTLILLLCYEMSTQNSIVVHAAGGLLLLARLLHFWGFGLHRGVSIGRTFGAGLNFALILMLAILNGYQALKLHYFLVP